MCKKYHKNTKFVDLYKLNLSNINIQKRGLKEFIKSLFENKFLRNSYILYRCPETHGSSLYRSTPILKRSLIDVYISLEEFRIKYKYNDFFINNRPILSTNKFLWLDTIVSKNLLFDKDIIKNILVKNAKLFSIKKHPNEELSIISKEMLANGSELIKLNLPMELYLLKKNVIVVSPTVSTSFNTIKELFPNRLVSLLLIYIKDREINKHNIQKYNNVEFLSDEKQFANLFK